MTRLPEGRVGQAISALLLVLVLSVVWVAAGSPLLEWYNARAEAIAGRGRIERRMVQIAASLPALQRQAEPATTTAVPVLDGATDAIAGAQLQQRVQAMATEAGATLSTAEVLPAEPASAYRRISLRVAVNAPWPVLIALLTSVTAGQGLSVDDLQLHGGRGFIRDKAAPIEASWVVLAFRPGTGP